MTVSVKLGQKFAVSCVLGVENLIPMVVSNPPVSMNTTIGFQAFIPRVEILTVENLNRVVQG